MRASQNWKHRIGVLFTWEPSPFLALWKNFSCLLESHPVFSGKGDKARGPVLRLRGAAEVRVRDGRRDVLAMGQEAGIWEPWVMGNFGPRGSSSSRGNLAGAPTGNLPGLCSPGLS